MVVSNPKEAIQNAKRTTSCDPGMCLRYVRSWLEIPPRDATAFSAWLNAKHRHPGDRTPPRGAPLFFKGSSAAGHITLSLFRAHQGNTRSTDWESRGNVSTTTINAIESRWRQQYLGWSEDLNGVWIPYLKGKE